MMETLTADELAEFNVDAWARGDYVADYSTRHMSPAETVLLAAYRGSLQGPVLELGPGTGRLTRVLVSLRADVTAVDVSPRMVEATQRNVPEARAEVGDLRDLSRFADGAFRAVVASNNLVDVLGDDGRRRALRELARLLTDDGVLLFSSHNQANIPYLDTSLGSYARGALSSPGALARALYGSRTFARRARNRRTARAFERQDVGYALVNDPVHDHRLVLYYIGRDAQERQLAEAGLTLVDCFDVDGRAVPAGVAAERSSELHYAARRQTSAAN
jgi:SAM-dependent methyltransferase